MPSTRELTREIPAVAEMHRYLREHYERHSVDQRSSFCLDLAAEEIFTNMVRHNRSEAESITLTVDVSPARFKLEMIDHGVEPFDADRLAPVDVTKPIDERKPGGLGVHLVKSLVDSLTYTNEKGDMKVTVVKMLEE